MKRFFRPVCVGAFGSTLLLGLPGGARAQALGTSYFIHSAQVPIQGTLRAGGKGFLVEMPLVVADSGVCEVMATPNGARLVVLRQSFRPTPDALLSPESNRTFGPQIVPGEASVTVWNTFTQKGTVVWRQRVAPGELFHFETAGTLHGPNGDRVLVSVTVEKANEKKPDDVPIPATGSILLVDTEKSVVRQVNVTREYFRITGTPLLDGVPDPSPRLPFASLVNRYNTSVKTLRFLRPDGTLTNPLALPENISWKGWQTNGTVLRGVQTLQRATKTTPAVVQWFDADPRANTLTPIETPPKTKPVYEEPPAPETLPELELVERPALPQSGTRAPSVWLQAKSAPNADPKTRPASVLLFAEGKPVFLLPRAAVFLSHGALYAAGLQTVSDATLTQIERKQTRDKLISSAKQVGLGLLGYLQDNDETFPASATGFSDTVGPYLKDPSVLTGFVYSPPTPLAQAQMTDVGQTVLGYLPGDGGKAILYADGHVKWQDNP